MTQAERKSKLVVLQNAGTVTHGSSCVHKSSVLVVAEMGKTYRFDLLHSVRVHFALRNLQLFLDCLLFLQCTQPSGQLEFS